MRRLANSRLLPVVLHRSAALGMLLYGVAIHGSCRLDNPAFRRDDSAVRPHDETTQPGAINESSSTNSETSGVEGPTPTKPSQEVSTPDQDPAKSTSEPPTSTESTTDTRSNSTTTSASTNSTSETATTSTETFHIPEYCGTGPDLCYLIEKREPGKIPNERGPTHDLTIQRGEILESAAGPSKGTTAYQLNENAIGAQTLAKWQPPSGPMAFDLYVKLDGRTLYPRTIFGLRGRLALIQDSGGVSCNYNRSETKTSYTRTNTWDGGDPANWYHVLCVYDGTHVAMWVNQSSFFRGPVTANFPGPEIPIQIGGDQGTPMGTATGGYAGFEGKISAIRIWTDMAALEKETSYTPD